MTTLTIKLSPLLGSELDMAVEAKLEDHRAGRKTGFTEADVRLYEKVEKSSVVTIEDEGEAAGMYNLLYQMVDYFDDWARDEGAKWRMVSKAARKHMQTLSPYIKTGRGGWAVDS